MTRSAHPPPHPAAPVREPLNVFDCALEGTTLVEASAGTGKTWNICGLYLRLLLQRQLEVQQILVVTFTNAATAELRERIRTRVAQTLARLRGGAAPAGDSFVDTLLTTLRAAGLDDEDMQQRLDVALQTFDEAAIFTIHGFCQRALADTPFSAGLPMAMELLTDDRALRLQVVHDFWRRHIAGDALPPALASHLLSAQDSPDKWDALLKRQLGKPLSRVIWPEGLDSADAADTAGATGTAGTADTEPVAPLEALAAAHATAQATWRAGRAQILALVTAALPRLNGTTYKDSSVATAAASWDTLLAGSDPLVTADGLDKLDLLTPTRLKPKKGQAPVQPHTFFDQAETLLAQVAGIEDRLARERLRLLRRFLHEAPPALRALKREHRVVAFDDMLFNLYQRLAGDAAEGHDTGLAAALRARFPAALIDEFQDTDRLQFAIFNAIHGDAGAPLFLVGDPKQAIYSFRNADLHTYLRAADQAGAAYTLAHNQRSSRALLHGLNALFSGHAQAFVLPGLHYLPVDYGDKRRKPFVDHTLAEAPRAPLQLWSLPLGEGGNPLPKATAQAAAAQACAGEIARLLGAAQQGRVLHGGQPLRGGDVAVLVRSHRHGRLMRRALAVLGVASVELSQASVYASPDAEELERLLAAVLQPAREPLLRAALATELLGRHAAEIEALSADETALLAVVTRFAGYRGTWLQHGIGAMLRTLMSAEGVHARLLARPDGERRLTNLLHLAEALQQAAADLASPELQLRWLQTQRADPQLGEDAAQLRLESDRNLVQVVTIHKSKGLEYPVVFCPFLFDGHSGAFPGGAEGREYHDDEELPVIDLRPRGADKDDPISARIALERDAENLRLLYVALTRAVHRCVLPVGSYAGARGSTTESGRSLLNWLVAGTAIAPEARKGWKPTPAEIDAAWAGFAERHACTAGGDADGDGDGEASVSWAPLPAGPWPPLAPLPLSPDALAALPPPERIAPAWWIGSYSSLSHGTRHEGAAADHDLRADGAGAGAAVADDERDDESAAGLGVDDVVDTAPWAGAASPAAAYAAAYAAASASAITPDDILDFPRGADAGVCLHAVFEQADFTDPDTWPAAIDIALRQHPPAAPAASAAHGPHDPAALKRQLQQLLADVLHTALAPGLELHRVPRTRRLVELEFTLPASRLPAATLAAVLREHGVPVPPLAFGVLEGYLRGFIDLVFEHDGRFHVLDWKSNHLGTRPADYAQPALAQAMATHGYHLQALLYAVALHRHLRLRLPGYRYGTHFGGVLYLFVRGVRPSWVDSAGMPTGVWAQTPPQALVERLSALFDEAEAGPAVELFT